MPRMRFVKHEFFMGGALCTMTDRGATRFWEKVDRTPECWTWKPGPQRRGYGAFAIEGRKFYAHRVSWELENEPIPRGLWVLHRCDNKVCVRPSHLFLGTRSDNMRDCASKGRLNFQKKPRIGSLNSRTNLTEADIVVIRSSNDTGVAMARRFSITPTQITRIRKRKSWSHV